MGKIVGEIGDRALAAGVPLFAIVGRNSVPPEAAERIALRGVARGDDARGDRGDGGAPRPRPGRT